MGWSSAGGGGGGGPDFYIAGNYYAPPFKITTTSGVAGVIDRMQLSLFQIGGTGMVCRGAACRTSGGGGNVKFVIYSSVNFRPSALLASTASTSTPGVNTNYTADWAGGDLSIAAGSFVWAGFITNSTNTYQAWGAAEALYSAYMGASDLTNALAGGTMITHEAQTSAGMFTTPLTTAATTATSGDHLATALRAR